MARIVGNKIGKVVNILIDGDVFQKKFDELAQANEFFKLVIQAKNGNQRDLDIMMGELNRMHRIVINGILEKDASETYFLKGFNHPIPDLLVETFNEYIENNYPIDAILNFWKLLMLNPDKKVRDGLFTFLSNYKFAITDNGYFIGYKVVQIHSQGISDKALINFVNEKFAKLKSWKKSPKNFNVIYDVEAKKYLAFPLDSEHEINDNLCFVGNLADLHESIINKTDKSIVYTDRYNQTTRIIIGKPVAKDRRFESHEVECSDNGLHIGSTTYVERFYNSGNVVLMVLINPAHVIHIPVGESTKMRTAEYYPYAVVEKLGERKFKVLEQPYFETDYANYEKERLESDLQTARNHEANGTPTSVQLDYKKLMEERLVDLNKILNIEV